VPAEFLDMLNGTVEGEISAHAVQPYYTILLANEAKLALSVKADGEDIVFTAH
jgi:histidine phosphotransferase ChpT